MRGTIAARRLPTAGGLVLALAWSACQAPPVPPEFQQEAVEAEPYRIGASDVLLIRVWKNQEITVNAPVLPDGKISVPLAGEVVAVGLTTEELEDVISGHLEEYITAPEVSVVVMDVRSKRVSVLGEVARNGPVSLAPKARLVDALSQAGGFGPFANRKKVKLIRRTENGDVEFTFNYDAYVKGKAPGTNVVLRPDDIIVVPD